MNGFDGLEDPNLPQLDVAEETGIILEHGASIANYCREMSDRALEKANEIRDTLKPLHEKFEVLVYDFEMLALAYQQAAKSVIDQTVETINMEWIDTDNLKFTEVLDPNS